MVVDIQPTKSSGPGREKPCLLGLRQGNDQTSLFSYIDKLEYVCFAYSKFSY